MMVYSLLWAYRRIYIINRSIGDYLGFYVRASFEGLGFWGLGDPPDTLITLPSSLNAKPMSRKKAWPKLLFEV